MEALRTNMATLRTLIENKLNQIDTDEIDLEKGQLWTFVPSGSAGTQFHPSGIFCWIAPGTGQVVIDIWGAGGSSASIRCCGAGLPGNPGAWARKCICVVAGCQICGQIGISCGNPETFCFKGCSEPTQVCWTGRNPYTGLATNGCMCAQGGRGGTAYCAPGSAAILCCFQNGGFCFTNYSNGTCGIVCNYGSGTGGCCAEAYGGDINKRGGFSCATFWTCYSNCPCSTQGHVAIPPGLFACDGAVVTHGFEADQEFSQWNGSGYHQFIFQLNAMRRSPARGIPMVACWASNKSCGCYQMQACIPFMPTGTGGVMGTPCGDHCNFGWRGGYGTVRINYIPR
jgi:hypothetical protein